MKPVTRSSSPLVTPPSRPPARLVGPDDHRFAGARPCGSATISSCTCEPGRRAPSTPSPIDDGLDRRNRHQRLGEPAIELAIPLDVAAEARPARCGRSLQTIRRACRRLPWPHRSPPIICCSSAVSTHRSGASGASACAASNATGGAGRHHDVADAGDVAGDLAADGAAATAAQARRRRRAPPSRARWRARARRECRRDRI